MSRFNKGKKFGFLLLKDQDRFYYIIELFNIYLEIIYIFYIKLYLFYYFIYFYEFIYFIIFKRYLLNFYFYFYLSIYLIFLKNKLMKIIFIEKFINFILNLFKNIKLFIISINNNKMLKYYLEFIFYYLKLMYLYTFRQ